ncbi:YmfQ family protein [Marinobacter sp. OP 3.4]|uniref:YmfQ family protein n=1 Tax=Marinobacter sp. OP 3.4 TaxID=3076501 RepID=UPI002E1DE221
MDRLTADQYRNQLTALAPPGQALPDQSDSNWQQLLQALAEEYARLDGRLHDLVKEGNPESTNELLTDWERLLDLPGPCDSLPETIQERRLAAHGKLIRVGGASPAYFIELAESLGYQVTITEYRPFRAGFSAAGDSLTNEEWLHHWMVNAAETAVVEFSAGQSAAGEPVRSWGEGQLECPIEQLKPAHTVVNFSYGE